MGGQQSAPAFDVVSVRPSDPSNAGIAIQPDPRNFLMRGVTLKFLVLYAYDIRDDQLYNAPNWIDNARYDVAGKMDDASSAYSSDAGDQLDRQKHSILLIRLQSLLGDRFQLQTHASTREMKVYGLTVGKGGSRLRPSSKEFRLTTAPGLLDCSHTSTSQLAIMLSSALSQTVIDKTGLKGIYDFTLNWTPDSMLHTESSFPDIFGAIQEQLGLQLRRERAPVQVVVIDHIEKPSSD